MSDVPVIPGAEDLSRAELSELAQEAGVNFCAGWLDGPVQALYRFAELIVARQEQKAVQAA